MILNRFPGNSPFARESVRDFSYFHSRNVLVHAKSSYINYDVHTAPLSIKSTLRGREIYEVDRAPIAVEPGSYLVVNGDQPYASSICSHEDVESFCIFFRDGLDREVAAPFNQSAGELLDDPFRVPAAPILFFQHLRRDDEPVTRQMKRLRDGINQGISSQLWMDEQFNTLMEALLRAHMNTIQEVDSLPFVRRTTRIEIYKRLHRAKDYLESSYSEPITLELLARVACLSRHHFLRLFKQVFQVTPHRYLTNLRLLKARKLIEEQNFRVADACADVGFENPSSFARLFKQQFGCPPRTLRRAHRK